MIPFPLMLTLFYSLLSAMFVGYALISCSKKKAPNAAPPTNTNSPIAGEATAPSPAGVNITTNTNSKDNKNVGNETKCGEQRTELNTLKDKSNVKQQPADADIKSPSNDNVLKSDAKPVSTFLMANNDKFVSKGGGIFVDKDGNPISQLAEPLTPS